MWNPKVIADFCTIWPVSSDELYIHCLFFFCGIDEFCTIPKGDSCNISYPEPWSTCCIEYIPRSSLDTNYILQESPLNIVRAFDAACSSGISVGYITRLTFYIVQYSSLAKKIFAISSLNTGHIGQESPLDIVLVFDAACSSWLDVGYIASTEFDTVKRKKNANIYSSSLDTGLMVQESSLDIVLVLDAIKSLVLGVEILQDSPLGIVQGSSLPTKKIDNFITRHWLYSTRIANGFRTVFDAECSSRLSVGYIEGTRFDTAQKKIANNNI